MKVGIIDSGKGGLALAKRLETEGINTILLMDRSFFPYGEKSKEFIIKRLLFLCRFLFMYNIDYIILGCNTASIYAGEFLANYFNNKVIGVFDILIPYLLSNNIFIGSKASCKFVEKKYSIRCIDGSKLISDIEYSKDKIQIEEEMYEKYSDCDSLVLGCTHFLYIDSKLFGKPVIDQYDILIKIIKSQNEMNPISLSRFL